MYVPVRGVELLFEVDDVLVGPDPLAAGEPLEGGDAVVHLSDEADEEGLVLGHVEGEEDVEDGVDRVRREQVDEEAEDAVVQPAVLEGAGGRPEKKRENFTIDLGRD